MRMNRIAREPKINMRNVLSGLRGNGNERCPRCGDRVYHAEQRVAEGRRYHPTCYTCRVCGCSLNATNVASSPDEIYCTTCYGRVRGPRGYGFGLGKGVLSMTLTSLQVEGLDEVIHNPATLGAVEQREIIARNTLTDWGHEMTCRCSLCLRNMTLIRTNAHDNMKTSNAANTALAYAWPFLVAADEPAEMTGTAKQVRRPKDIFTANTLAIVPNEENRRKILGRKVPADRGEPIAFLEKLSDNSIPLPSFRVKGRRGIHEK